jgi:hypothetical protein
MHSVPFCVFNLIYGDAWIDWGLGNCLFHQGLRDLRAMLLARLDELPGGH